MKEKKQEGILVLVQLRHSRKRNETIKKITKQEGRVTVVRKEVKVWTLSGSLAGRIGDAWASASACAHYGNKVERGTVVPAFESGVSWMSKWGCEPRGPHWLLNYKWMERKGCCLATAYTALRQNGGARNTNLIAYSFWTPLRFAIVTHFLSLFPISSLFQFLDLHFPLQLLPFFVQIPS